MRFPQILAFCLIFLFALPVQAFQNEEHILQAMQEPIGRLNWGTSALDIGEKNQGETAEFVFNYFVSGTGSVKVLGLHHDCGCLESSLKAGQVLASGEQGTMRIKLHTESFSGLVDKTIMLMTNEEPPQRLHRLRVKARIKRLVDISPPVVTLKWPQPSDQKAMVVRLKSLTQQALTISKVDFNRDLIDIDYRPVGDGWEIHIKWKGAPPTGSLQESIKVEASTGLLTIPIMGVNRAQITH